VSASCRDGASSTATLEFALAYAAAGWAVLPLQPGKKIPDGTLVRKGFRDATCDRAQITSWFTKNPSAGVGIHPWTAGTVVLDIDVKNGKRGREALESLEAKYGELPRTLTARTPSGGEHRVFRCSRPIGNRVLAPDIDVRGADGYIACEPTEIEGRKYQWIDWDVTTDKVPEAMPRTLLNAAG
jgi:putative DNA primase/helicase